MNAQRDYPTMRHRDMNRRSAYGLILLLASAGLVGCFRQPVPYEVVQRAREADRVTLTYVQFDREVPKPLSPSDAKALVEVISAARKQSSPASAAEMQRVYFHKGTNLLLTLSACFGANVFGIGGTTYEDTTGTLKTLDAKYQNEPGTANWTR